MKTYTFSKPEVDYLQPIQNNLQSHSVVLRALDTALQVYVVNVVFKRLGLPTTTKAKYDLNVGELYVEDETPPTVEEPEKK